MSIKRDANAPVYVYKGKPHAPILMAHYHWPKGQSYHHYGRGMHLPRAFWIARYFISDLAAFGLLPPPDGYQWVRYGPDMVLVKLDDGSIGDSVQGAFEDSTDVPDVPLDGDDGGDAQDGSGQQ